MQRKKNGWERYLARLTPKGRARVLAADAREERFERFMLSWARRNGHLARERVWVKHPTKGWIETRRMRHVLTTGSDYDFRPLRAAWALLGEPRYAI